MRRNIFPIVVFVIAISFSIYEILVNTVIVMHGFHMNAMHLGFLLALIFLLYPVRGKGKGLNNRFSIPGVVLAILGMAVGVYIVLFEEELHLVRLSVPILRDYIFAVIAVLLTLEAGRRTIGWPLTILAIIAILYARFGEIFPGVFFHTNFGWERILYRLYLTYEGIFGITASIAATYIFLFLLFGAFLYEAGVSDFFNKIALAIAGRRRGGPAQVAVVSSSIMGTISGSAVANVATTGVFTIPLMKRIGYKPAFAGAVEASASTGGQIMPPIMGAAAFVMASYLGIPYLKVAVAAIIPAILYYLAVGFSIDTEARKHSLKGLPPEELPKASAVFKEGGHLIIPIIVVVGVLVAGKTPILAAISGIASTFLVSFVRRKTMMTPKKLCAALEKGARQALEVCLACMVCGFIICVAGMTGIGSVLAYNIIELAHAQLFPALLFCMFISILLSMGVPTTACYIIVSIVAAPALLQMGVLPLAAHFFVFWFAVMSNLTPPVALASFTAAGLAGSNLNQTALTALRIAFPGFIVPFLVVYYPFLLIGSGVGGHPLQIALVTIGVIMSIIVLASAFTRYLLKPVTIYETALLSLGAIIFLIPGHAYYSAIGITLMGIAIAIHVLRVKAKKTWFNR